MFERRLIVKRWLKIFKVGLRIHIKTLSLEEFLTPEIINLPRQVQSKILIPAKSEKNNRSNTVKDALSETNNSTSPGLDGFSYTVLKRFKHL